MVGNDEELMDRVHSYHNCGRPYGSMPKTSGYPMSGNNRRMTEYQAAILLNQMKRLEADTELRWSNGQYLTSKIKDIPGIVPHKLYEGVTRAVYHLYPFRYLKEQFNNAPREKFLAALERRRHAVQRRVWSPVQRRSDRGGPDLQELHAGIPQGPARPLSRRAALSRQRPALPGSGVDQPGTCC